MNKKIVCFLLAIAALGILVAGCDLFESVDSGSTAYEPLVIKAKTVNGEDVEIEITRGTAPRVVLTPANGDNYVMRKNGVVISRGTIAFGENRIFFYPSGGGQAFTATYSGGGGSGAGFEDTVITIYELPDEGGTVTPIIPPGGGGPPSTSAPSAADRAAKLASDLNLLYGAGTVTVSSTIVTLAKDIKLERSLEIQAGVTLVVPADKTLDANGSAAEDGIDPDDPPFGNGIAGSGSYQITGAGTLDVKGTIEVRNRALRAANTIIYPNATYKVYGWNGTAMVDNGSLVGGAGSLATLITLTTGTLEVAYSRVTGDTYVHDAYTFTLKGDATLNVPFSFADSDNIARDSVIIGANGSLDAGSNTITSPYGTLTVEARGTLSTEIRKVKVRSTIIKAGATYIQGSGGQEAVVIGPEGTTSPSPAMVVLGTGASVTVDYFDGPVSGVGTIGSYYKDLGLSPSEDSRYRFTLTGTASAYNIGITEPITYSNLKAAGQLHRAAFGLDFGDSLALAKGARLILMTGGSLCIQHPAAKVTLDVGAKIEENATAIASKGGSNTGIFLGGAVLNGVLLYGEGNDWDDCFKIVFDGKAPGGSLPADFDYQGP